ncbi:SnoaL-like polyketide cyclase [Serratia entomophila]|uniref:nuclear transport factor 2 family protein n=1 Tax=Serratia entomophila TaxID=42906 RepID=UPI00217AF99A|nr:ester cyclase [Serratia entomophila]CAI0811855.1 SnoaL-like polyketide cyclase [Serratia entomophila]CAI1538941.1 SnoaL-like polyketide cyclase [Serratia entomophila]CAI1647201.1 SnoaL-like polyketide cyclase [Serratia entomophila]CAI1821744.1 SnoaL-like polyketide cyclase [Serratia entomophila]CAI2012617.1 SnoaL-like polyketide cyclase [Serratia entomophila]
MKKAFIPLLIAGGLLTSYPALAVEGGAAQKHAVKGYHHGQQKLNVVEDLYAGFFNRHDIGVAQKLIVENYKQHNPFVGDGIKPFLDFFSQNFKDNPQYSAKIYRSAVSGDLVYVHVLYKNNPQDRGTASVDIYRVNDRGQITEHWDVNQEVPEKSANDNTMF